MTVDLTLVAEASRRSEALWVGVSGGPPRLVWHVWHDGAVCLVGGRGEQELPALEDRAVVTVRSRARPTDRVVRFEARVEAVQPGTPAWDQVTPLLAAARLNAPDAGSMAERWAAGGVRVLRLVPDP